MPFFKGMDQFDQGWGVGFLAAYYVRFLFYLLKWRWRFGEERAALWRKVIADKYGVYRYRCLRLFLSIVCRVFWGSIAHLGDESNCWGENFYRGVGNLVGEGRSVFLV